ncbi:MAG: hypothetical protein KDB53_07210, partial [Planctomycetes bacterium]|nr:hypothetical protein [Planctomycetota bacterium]
MSMYLSKSQAGLATLLLALGLVFTGCSSQQQQQSQDDTAQDATSGEVQESGPQDWPTASGELEMGVADAQRKAAIVKDTLKRADDAANAGDHAAARKLYREAMDWEPTNERAARGYANMTELLAGQSTESGGFAAAAAQQQEAQIKANYFYNEGIKARAEGRLADAVDNLDRSYQILKYNESPLATDLNADFVKGVLDDTHELKDRQDRTSDQREREQMAAMQRAEDEKESRELERRRRALWETLIDKFEAEDYDRVERIAEALLELDYKDTDAARMREMARVAKRTLSRERHVSDYRNQWESTFEEIKMKMTLETGVIGFPSERKWKDISSRGAIQLARNAVAEESEADLAVRQALTNTVLPKIDWSTKLFSEAIAELRSQANVNIVASPEARVAGEDTAELGLEFKQQTAGNALAAVCGRCGVAYTIENGLVRVQTKEEAARGKVVEFYNVRDLVNGIRSFPGVQLNLNASGVGGEEDFFDEDETEPTRTLEMESLIDVIKSTVDPAWDEDGGNRIDPKAETGVLIVRQTPSKHRLIRKILSDLRQSTGIQVSIESRFITVENNCLQEVGVDPRGLGDDTAGVGVSGPGLNRPFDDFGQAGSGFGTPSAPLGIGTGNDSGVFFSDLDGNTDARAR